MAESWYQPFKELFTHVKALGTAGLGKLGIETGTHSIEAGAGSGVLEQIGIALPTAANGTMAGAFLYGGFGVLSAVTNQIEYGAARGRVADFYHEELAAKLGKAPSAVRDDDIDVLAKGDPARGIPANKVIDDKIHHERSIRNIGIGASFLASLAVCTLMSTLIGGVAAAAGAAVGAKITLGFGMAIAAKVLVGVLAYSAIKRPLVNVGESLLGLNHATTHDLIVGVAKDREHGKSISREQVVEIFISANRQISEYVSERYGAEYEHLALADKVRVANDLANVLPVDKIARSINLGTSNASELAFTVEGDVSGVLPKAPTEPSGQAAPETFLSRFGHKCRNVVKAINHALHPETAHPIAQISAINHAARQSMPREESPVVEFNEQGPSFVERLGRGQQEAGKSHVAQLAERSAQEQVTLPGSNTLQ